ncbi:MAG: hypothetical protein LIO46_00415, partial [Clostridiales bacterium]|nr:hypothetical protein [Clostridiales bacterium]
KKLFDIGFSDPLMMQLVEGTGLAQNLAVAGGTQDTAALQLASIPVYGVADQGTVGELTSVLHLKQFEYAPLEAGTVVGYMYYYSDGRQVAEVPVIAAETVERYEILEEQKQEGFFRRIIQWFQNLFKR